MSRARVDIVDETYIHAPAQTIRPTLTEPGWCANVWPHLALTVARDRGDMGVRWVVTGQVVGEMEVWLEPFRAGTIVHHYLRGTRGARAPRDVSARHSVRWKRAIHALKDRLEGTSG